ncbi:MAG: hypothetical protein DLM72_17545 [Candidatus Nitrosopolaris wilkensis]|nr:MAG: hypothetical protein DLM72_17545 [Candidatus Nitrosopolaris wilkensis]
MIMCRNHIDGKMGLPGQGYGYFQLNTIIQFNKVKCKQFYATQNKRLSQIIVYPKNLQIVFSIMNLNRLFVMVKRKLKENPMKVK